MPASYVEMCMLQAIMEGWWYSYSGSAAYYGGGQCNFAYNLANWAFYEKQSNPKKEASTSTRGLVGSTYTIGGKLTKVPANQIEKAQKGNILYNNSLKHMALRGGEFITADLQYYESTALQFAHVKDDDKHTGAIALPLKDNASKPAINQFVKYGVMKKIDLTK